MSILFTAQLLQIGNYLLVNYSYQRIEFTYHLQISAHAASLSSLALANNSCHSKLGPPVLFKP